MLVCTNKLNEFFHNVWDLNESVDDIDSRNLVFKKLKPLEWIKNEQMNVSNLM